MPTLVITDPRSFRVNTRAADVICLCGGYLRDTAKGYEPADACTECVNTPAGEPCPTPDRHKTCTCTVPDLIHCDHHACVDPARLGQAPCSRGYDYCCGCCGFYGGYC